MVSIIVPVYNINKYLSGCVESLMAQTCADVEIILVDDGSTDGSGALCDALGAKDSRIRVIHKPNGGLSDARNTGLDAARGQWVLFVDGDDYLASSAVERLLELADPDTDLVQFHYQETPDTTWEPPADQAAQAETETEHAQMWRRLYELGGVGASSCTKLWNRQIFAQLRFQKGLQHEDEELLNRALPLCRKAVYTALVLYGYVTRSGSIVRSGFRKKSMDILTILDERIPVLEALGCQELVKATYEWQFRSAAWQYCLARRGGFKEEAGALRQRLLTLAKKPGLTLPGQYALLYRASRVTSAAPAIYYLLRRATGKT